MQIEAVRRFGERVVKAIVLCCVLALLAGCTTKGSQTPVNGTTGKADSATQTLKIALNVEPTALDPARVQDLYTSELLMNCFEGLVRFDKDNALEPALAEKWELSPDGKTYTFHLRKNALFHNGRPLKAADVKYSWERAVAPQTASPVAANYLEGVVGLKDAVAGKSPEMAGIKIVDDLTLTVTLDRPRTYFLSMIAYTSNWIVCKEAIESAGKNFGVKAMVGTGAFHMTEYLPGQKMAMEANAKYWGGAPKVARLEYPILLSSEAQYNSFAASELDIVGGIAPSRYAQNKVQGKFTAEYQKLPSANIVYFVMQMERQPIFAKKEVRQAFACAIDREKLVKVAYRGVAQLADGFVPPTLRGGVPYTSPLTYDPVKAKKFLASAGYPDGKNFPALTLSVVQHQPETLEQATLIQSDLRASLGIDIKILEREAGEYFTAGNRREMECYLASWYADYPDPQNFLSTLLTSGAALNRSGYSNPKFDLLCRQADSERDTQKRAKLYAAADTLLMEDVGVLPLSYSPRLLLVKQGVTGWQSNACTLLPHFATMKR